MRQFFETYRDEPKLSTVLRELPWSSHLHILSRAKRPEEREFYPRMAGHECESKARRLSPVNISTEALGHNSDVSKRCLIALHLGQSFSSSA